MNRKVTVVGGAGNVGAAVARCIADKELADVVGYSFALANELGLDLSTAIRAKMIKNAQKYPAQEFRGRYKRDD